MNDSNPGQTRSSMGGVGYNVSLACKYGLESPSCSSGNIDRPSYRFISVVADDFAGRSLLKQLDSNKIDTSGIQIIKDSKISTAQYSSIHNTNGELLVACADMAIIEEEFFTEHTVNQLARAKPECVVLDCNISSSVMNNILQYIRNNLEEAKVIIEPTSSPKAARLSHVNSKNLKVFPNNIILLVTPTVAELNTFHSSFSNRELFDDYDDWFPLLDTLGIDSLFREKLNKQAQQNDVLREGLNYGFLQQSFQLLPYLPNILLKLGPSGLLYIGLSTSIGDYSSIPTTSDFCPEFTITSNGREFIDSDGKNKKMGIVIQYFPIPEVNKILKVKNVTGAGDSLLGYLIARLLLSSENKVGKAWLDPEIYRIEDEWFKWESIYKAQISSGLSLESNEAISPEIAKIK
ncbi:unnamed protein product [Debaryomyces tyrocola]|nr:unnamed protein product [Debaryomyces tyrocola]